MLDPLYGNIKWHNQMCWDLFQSSALTRMRDISLSAVPSSMSYASQASSRFEHSMGVAHLAHVICQREAFHEFHDELVVASFLHDSGSPPFSHTSELFMEDYGHKTHEEAVSDVLSEREMSRILKRYNVDPEPVYQLITGQGHALGPLLAGSIDIDNLDNSIRLARSLGAFQTRLPYRPLEILKAYRLTNKGLALSSTQLIELLGWKECRRVLYDEILYSDSKLSPASMLYRALEYAYADGILDNEFFRMREGEAAQYLFDNGAKPVKSLLEDAFRWRHYQRAAEVTSHNEAVGKLADDWMAVKRIADGIARSLKIKRHHVAVNIVKLRTHKPITLPFIGEKKEACTSLFSKGSPTFSIVVFVHPDSYKEEMTTQLSVDDSWWKDALAST